jgi:nitrite reductase/ring-hydroxylating ferredoxin subunit
VTHHLGRLEELLPAQPKLVEVGDLRLVLVRSGNDVLALDEMCGHQGGPLSEGKVSGSRVTCPWHGWTYDLRTGQCLMPTRGGAIRAYQVRVENGEILLEA